jgi:hypothetical protein
VAEPANVNQAPSSDPWEARIGAPAASARVKWKRNVRLGIILLLALPLGVLVGVAVFAENAGNPSVPLVATIATIAIVVGIFGAVSLMAAYSWRRATIDSAFIYLKRRSPDVRPVFVATIIRSLDAFDSSYTPQRGPEFQNVPVVLPGWNPDIRRSILPGATEQSTVRIHRIVFYIGIVGLLIMAGIGATGHFPGNSTWFGGWSVVGVILLVSFAFWVAAIAKGRREFLHGYTTAPRGASLRANRTNQPVDAWICLDFVDGQTGYLLRQSDEQLLTRPRWAERLRQIRAKHAGESPVRLEPGDITG